MGFERVFLAEWFRWWSVIAGLDYFDVTVQGPLGVVPIGINIPSGDDFMFVVPQGPAPRGSGPDDFKSTVIFIHKKGCPVSYSGQSLDSLDGPAGAKLY